MESGLAVSRSKECLRLLAQVLRKVPVQRREEGMANMAASLSLAKEAVEKDPSDGLSWYLVGNSYLASFFLLTLDHAVIYLFVQFFFFS